MTVIEVERLTARLSPAPLRLNTVIWTCKPVCALTILSADSWSLLVSVYCCKHCLWGQAVPAVTGETLLLLLLLLRLWLPCKCAGRRQRQQGALLLSGVVLYQISMDVCPLLRCWITGHCLYPYLKDQCATLRGIYLQNIAEWNIIRICVLLIVDNKNCYLTLLLFMLPQNESILYIYRGSGSSSIKSTILNDHVSTAA